MNVIILFGVFMKHWDVCTMGFGLGNLGIWVPILGHFDDDLGISKILAGSTGAAFARLSSPLPRSVWSCVCVLRLGVFGPCV